MAANEGPTVHAIGWTAVPAAADGADWARTTYDLAPLASARSPSGAKVVALAARGDTIAVAYALHAVAVTAGVIGAECVSRAGSRDDRSGAVARPPRVWNARPPPPVRVSQRRERRPHGRQVYALRDGGLTCVALETETSRFPRCLAFLGAGNDAKLVVADRPRAGTRQSAVAVLKLEARTTRVLRKALPPPPRGRDGRDDGGPNEDAPRAPASGLVHALAVETTWDAPSPVARLVSDDAGRVFVLAESGAVDAIRP